MKSLDDLLNDNPDAADEESTPVAESGPDKADEAPPAEAKSEGDEPTAEASDESTGDKQEEASPAPETSVPITALHGERDRRQAAERELAEIRAKLETEREAKPMTSVFESEEGFLQDLESRFNQQLINRTLNESQFHAEQKFGRDVVAEKVEAFKQMVAENPAYAEEFSSSVSPYFTLVDIVDRHSELEAMRDLDAYKAKLKAEAMAEAKKELKDEQQKSEELKRSVPESLAGDSSKGNLTGSSWGGPPSLESLLD